MNKFEVVTGGNIGAIIATMALQTQNRLVLIAPFMKSTVISKILALVPRNVEIRCLTRWRADEIIAGVSDLEVYEIVKQKNGVISLLSNLHAKYYRSDEVVAIGSSNLTKAALGWTKNGNQELMIRTTMIKELAEFEDMLFGKSVLVDDGVYKLCR